MTYRLLVNGVVWSKYETEVLVDFRVWVYVPVIKDGWEDKLKDAYYQIWDKLPLDKLGNLSSTQSAPHPDRFEEAEVDADEFPGDAAFGQVRGYCLVRTKKAGYSFHFPDGIREIP